MEYEGKLISIIRTVFGYGQNKRLGYKVFINTESPKGEVDESEKMILSLIKNLMEEAEG